MAIPTSLDPAVVEHFRGRDEKGQPLQDSVLDALAGALQNAQATALQIEAAAKAIALDPTMTPEGNAIRVKNLAHALGEKAARGLDSARARALQELDRIENKMVPPPVNPALASEIRSALRRMPGRDKLISKAIHDGDDTTMAALASGPSWLSGITESDLALRMSVWRKRKFPDETARLERLRKAAEALDRAGGALVTYIRHTAGANSTRVQLAEAAAARAQEAEAAAKHEAAA
jgi:hypothetical protein